ncbi:MAG: tetratricopeptide repeat protein, partial [Archaeoglobaceae archaeon]|nr:tetratricopeptide repeat protein [Archaeoglobaceae archaeon]
MPYILAQFLNAIEIKPKLNPLEEFERLEGECKNLKNEYLRSFALGHVLINWAKILLKYGLLKDANEKLKKVLDLCNVEINVEGIKDFFKPLGGNPKDKANENLDALKASAHYDLGIALIDLGEFDEAIEQFKIAEKLYRELKDFVEELKCKGRMKRVEILKDWEFGKPIKYDLMEEALNVWHSLDLEFKSCLCGEYTVSLALDGYSKEDLEKVGVFTPEDLAVSCGILSLLNSDILKFVLKIEELKKKIVRDLENEGIDFEEEDITRLMALLILNGYDSKMSKGLKDEFERRMRIVENFDEEIRSLKDRGYDEEEAKKILGSDFGGLGLLNFAKKAYEENKREAERLVKLTTTTSSPHA